MAIDKQMQDLLRPPKNHIVYFVDGKDGRRAPNRELFEKVSFDVAKDLVGNIDNTQLRKFFAPVDDLNSRAKRGAINGEQIQAELALLKARVAYAYKRPGVKVPRKLVRMITDHAASVEDQRDLAVFRRFFECVVAYHRALSLSRSQR